MPGVPSNKSTNCALNTQCIKRLHEPTFGATAFCQVHICITIEQHQNRNVWNAVIAVIKTQIHGHSHAAHSSKLKIKNCDIWGARFYCFWNVATIAADSEGIFWRTEGCKHFVEYPLGVGSNQNMHVLSITR